MDTGCLLKKVLLMAYWVAAIIKRLSTPLILQVMSEALALAPI